MRDGALFASVTKELEAMRPDLIVMYDTDHLNTFFLDNLPVFAVGVTEAFKGPNDEPRWVPIYTIKSRPDVAGHIRRICVEDGFDLALTQDFTVDHSVVVPLHFMTPTMRGPSHSDLRERAHSAAAVGPALLRTRHHGSRARSRAGRRICAWSSSAAAASRSKCSARASRPASRTACPIRIGRSASARSSSRVRQQTLIKGSHAGADAACRQCRRRAPGLDRHAGRRRRATGRNSSRRRWSRGTPMPPGTGVEPGVEVVRSTR